MTLFLGALVIAAAVYAVIRRVDVRLALCLAALALGALTDSVPLILRTFFVTLCNEPVSYTHLTLPTIYSV